MRTINAPEIPEMKQIDLYQKYRGFVPDYFYSLICSKPSNKMINSLKDYH